MVALVLVAVVVAVVAMMVLQQERNASYRAGPTISDEGERDEVRHRALPCLQTEPKREGSRTNQLSKQLVVQQTTATLWTYTLYDEASESSDGHLGVVSEASVQPRVLNKHILPQVLQPTRVHCHCKHGQKVR